MSTPFVVITRDGPLVVPYSYALAAGESFQPETVTATFDGTGAGSAFIPCLSVYAANGKLLGRYPASQVPSGDTAEVTWAPFLTAQASAAAATGISWATMAGTDPAFASSGFGTTETSLDLASLETNDPTTFTAVTSAGHHRLQINTAGHYYIRAGVSADSGVLPNAGAFIQAAIGIGTPEAFVDELFAMPWVQDGAADWTAEATQSAVCFVNGVNGPPQQVNVIAGQNSGVAVFLNSYLFAMQLDTASSP